MEQELKLELIKLVKASKDPYTFLIEYCQTVDERDGQLKYFPRMGDRKLCNKCKLSFSLPKEEKQSLEFGLCPQCNQELQVPFAFLKVVCDFWKENLNCLIPKSRQMMASWTTVALHLWLVLFHKNQLVIFQSETEDKAKELIKRLKDIWFHLPEVLRLTYPLVMPPSQTQFVWKHGSRIRSVPQGVTQVTGWTPSAVLSDEMAIQKEAEAAYYETRPALAGGGRFTGVSTPNGKDFFCRLVADKKEGDVL